VTASQSASCTGAVSIAGPSVDGYYDHGTTIALTVTPDPAWKFTGWSDDLAGTAMSESIAVNGEVYVTASYNLTTERLPVTGISRVVAAAGDAPFDVMLYGTGFTPATVRSSPASAARAPCIDSNRIRVPLTAADLAFPGELAHFRRQRRCRRDLPDIECVGARRCRSQATPGPRRPPVVEFYNAALDHYFVTANAGRDGKARRRHVQGMGAHTAELQGVPADSSALSARGLHAPYAALRQSGRAGLDSHFYSASKDECDDVKRKFPTAWVFESPIVFQSVVPDRTTGQCPDGTVAVYRLFNQRADANHRYTTDPPSGAEMIAKNYVPEGYGPWRGVVRAR
jgi:hypothetical protein